MSHTSTPVDEQEIEGAAEDLCAIRRKYLSSDPTMSITVYVKSQSQDQGQQQQRRRSARLTGQGAKQYFTGVDDTIDIITI